MDISLRRFHLINLNQDHTNILNTPVTRHEIEAIIKYSQPKKKKSSQGQIVLA